MMNMHSKYDIMYKNAMSYALKCNDNKKDNVQIIFGVVKFWLMISSVSWLTMSSTCVWSLMRCI